MSAAQPRDKGRAANLALVLLISSGVIVSLIAFTLIWKLQERTQALEFERNAADINSSLQRNIHASLHELESIAAFYAASREIERHEFRDFVNPFLSRNSSIQALEWVPRVPGPQRAAFEQAAKRDGFPAFQITEMNLQGQLVRAARRAEHFPVYFVEPYKGNEPALGFDLASEPKRLQALRIMRDTGEAVASPPIKLVQETSGQQGFLIFWPIYRRGAPVASIASRRANLEGFLLGVFRIGDLVQGALKELEPRGLDVYLLDESAPQGQRLLYFKSSRPGRASPDSNAEQGVAILRKDLHHAATLEIVGRKWLVLSKPGPDFIGTKGTWQPWAVLLGGLVFTVLLAVYINDRKRAEEAVRRLNEELDLRVVERTAQLEAARNSLQDEIIERKRVESLLHAIGRAHSKFITRITPDVLFGDLLSDLLSLTHSEYGFIGEILHADNGEPYLKTHAITNIAWNEETREMYARFAPNLEFFNLKTLFGAVITTGEPVIANDPSTDPRRGGPPPGHPPMQAFLGLPLRGANELVGMVGIANRPGGYDEGLVEYLQPLLNSCGNLIAAQRSDQHSERSEQALKESEQRFRTMADTAPVMVWMSGPDKLCTYFNKVWLEFTGRTLEQEMGNGWAEGVHPDDLERCLDTHVTAFDARQDFKMEYRLRRYGGEYRWIVDAGTPRMTSNGDFSGYIGSCIDITERKQAEEALREMSLALANAMPGISRLDSRGRYVSVNQIYARMLGFEPHEMVGGDWTPTVHLDDRGNALAAYNRMLANGSGEFEARAVRKDGSEFHKHVLMVKRVDEQGTVIGHHCFMRDITERKQAEEALLASEKRGHIENAIRHLLLSSQGDQMYADVLDLILKTFQSRFGFFGYIREEDGALVCPSMTRDIWEQCEVDKKSIVFPREVWGGLWGRVLLEKRAFYKNEPHRVPKGHLPLFRSLGAPILNDGRLIGSVHVANRDTNYREEDRELLEGLCSIIGPVLDVRLQKDRLEAESLQAEATREALYRASLAIQEPLDLQQRLDRLLQTARTVLELDRINILLADPEGQWLQAAASLGTEDPLEAIRVPIGPKGGGIAQAFQTKRMVIWDGQGPVPGPLRLQPPYDQIEALRSQAFANVPLVVQGQAIGVLGTDRRHSGRPLDRSTLELLQLFAAQAAMSIEHARTFEQLQFHSAALKRFYEATAQINLSLDLDETLRMIAKAGVGACGSATGNVILFDDEGKISRFALWDPSGVLTPDKLRIRPDGLTRKALESGKMEIIPDFSQEPPGRINPAPLKAGRLAAACVPLPLREGTGVLWVHFNVPHHFTHEERALLQAFAQEAAVALHKARLFEQVQAGRQRLQALSRRLVELQEAERRHIARELHDEIGQVLTGLQLALEMGTRVTTAAARRGIGEAKALVHELISRVRELSLDLRPAMLDDLGLLPALLWHIERYTAQTKVKVIFEHAGLETRFSPEAETAAYRIVQEALTNVARHAAVNLATVVLGVTQDMLCLQIHDTGVGFDSQAALVSETSSGLAGMRERATLLGGRLVVESVPGAGTRLTAELPLSDTLKGRADAREYPAGG